MAQERKTDIPLWARGIDVTPPEWGEGTSEMPLTGAEAWTALDTGVGRIAGTSSSARGRTMRAQWSHYRQNLRRPSLYLDEPEMDWTWPSGGGYGYGGYGGGYGRGGGRSYYASPQQAYAGRGVGSIRPRQTYQGEARIIGRVNWRI